MKLSEYFVLLLPLLIGCSTIPQQNAPHYLNSEVEGRHLLFIPPLVDSIRVLNPEDVERIFGEHKRSRELVFRDNLYEFLVTGNEEFLRNKIIVDSINTTIAESLRNPSNLLLLRYPLDDSDTNHLFYIPKKEWLLANGQIPDLAVSITSIQVGRVLPGNPKHYSATENLAVDRGSSVLGGIFSGGNSSYRFGAQFSFVIYDYTKNQWIMYGTPFAKIVINPEGFDRYDWSHLFGEIKRFIFIDANFIMKINGTFDYYSVINPSPRALQPKAIPPVSPER